LQGGSPGLEHASDQCCGNPCGPPPPAARAISFFSHNLV